LAAAQAKVADIDRALATARRAVDLDPYQDIPWRLIADLHEAAGDGTAAERARQQHLRVRAELAIG
jgi:predicted TPR repeat methyltransferase